MSDVVIKTENISKAYQLGTIGTGSFRQDLNKFWQTYIRGKKSSFFSEVKEGRDLHDGDYFWALKNIDFEVKQGESWGIIGKNGAGKSTLLKILSRITRPTQGIIKGKGKISSLLEVGTGFHPELTGRENIFISGYMMGMKKNEVKKKFDEIVEFSGIQVFLDTPVKRYSSGMYVRLAFAVAAHLEPDILIIDEALAVGDLEFQKRCLGKMNDATTKLGRTVIFVSHNLQAVTNLCTRTLLLEDGKTVMSGDTKHVIGRYLSKLQKKLWIKEFETPALAPGNEEVRILYIELVPDLPDPLAPIDIRTPLTVKFKFYYAGGDAELSVDLLLYSITGECIFDIPSTPFKSGGGFFEGQCLIPGNFLNDGSYYFTLYFSKDTSMELYSYDECLLFEVADYRENNKWYEKWWGHVRPAFPMTVRQIQTPSAIHSITN
jgi:lipopolysaccharide transport system ATP-binding protein